MSKNIFVGSLAWGTTSEGIEQAFARYGVVTSAKVISDRETGRSKGFAFVEMETGGEVYNISGQNVYQIKEIIPILESKINQKIIIEQDPKLFRPTDEPIIFGDSSRLKRDTGWTQKYSLDQTLGDMIQYFRGVRN